MLVCRMIIETVSPLHIGGGQQDFALDSPVDRDVFDLWRIPGTSIAGVLRAASLKLYGEDLTKELFGSANSEKDISSSLIWCSDGRLLDIDYETNPVTAYEKKLSKDDKKTKVLIPQGPYVRDHVKISLATGTAEDGAKFDEEIVPSGARFAIELKFDGRSQEADSAETGRSFLKLCYLLNQGAIGFGAGSVNGLGRIKGIYCDVRSFDMTKTAGLESWLNLKKGIRFSKHDGQICSLEKIEESELHKHGKAETISFDLDLPLQSSGPILPGGQNPEEQGIDMVCLKTPRLDYRRNTDKYVRYIYTLPGSSFRGAVRHRCYEIAEIKYGKEKANNLLKSIFGYIPDKDSEKDSAGAAGKICCSEIYFENVSTKRVQHVAIDRFTGGALDGALFDEAPIWNSNLKFKVNITAAELTPLENELLCHSLLDLLSGRLPIGGGTNRGNGVVALNGYDPNRNLGEQIKSVKLKAGNVKGDAVSTLYELMTRTEEAAE